MYVTRLRIRSFRGIADAEVFLGQHSVLVGANNAGKTTIIDALNLVLGRGHLRRKLFEYDFFGGNPKPESRVQIEAVITGFSSEDPGDHPEVFHFEKGGIPMWWNENERKLHDSAGAGRSLAVELGFCARFDDETLEDVYKLYYVESGFDPFLDEGLRKVREPFLHKVGVFLVPARRTWQALLSFKSDLFRKVLASQSAIPGASIRELRDSLRDPDSRLETESPFSDIVGRLNQELDAFFQPNQSDLRFRPTAGDTPRVLDAIVPHIKARSGVHLPVGHHGSGVVSLQTLLLLMEFGRRRRDTGENFILAAEEPELHLHPGQHRRVVARMRGIADQTIVTTHSAQVASFYRPNEILSVHCDAAGTLQAKPLIPAPETPEKKALMRLFTLHRAEVCEAVMNDVVVLPEGITDFRWLHALAQESVTAEGWDEPSVEEAVPPLGVLPTQAAHVVQTYEILSDAVPLLLPLVDGDKAGDQYVANLMRLTAPPAAVVALKQDWEVEDVVAWVLLGDLTAFEEVKDVLGNRELTPSELSTQLAQKPLKTHYGQHELLAGLVGMSKLRANRARRFLRGIAAVGFGLKPEALFVKDEEASTAATSVWRFDPSLE